MSDARSIVQGHHRIEPRKTWRYHLGSAAEAGKKMRLNKTCSDLEVGMHPTTIEKDSASSARPSNLHKRSVVPSVMTDHTTRPRKLRSDHLFDFRIVVAAVGAGRNEYGHIVVSNSRHLCE